MNPVSRPIASLLFMPAGSRRFVAKAATLDIDAIVLDLEDATPPAEKAAARAGLAETLAGLRGAPAQCFVRVNGPLTPWYQQDLSALRDLDVDGIVVPKVESPRDLEVARALCGLASDPGTATPVAPARPAKRVVAGIETLAGVVRLGEVLGSGWAHAVYFGAEDLAADFGFGPSALPDVSAARAQVALLARRHGALAIDRAVVDVRDPDGFAADARAGRALGYTGKICLTPAQALAAQAAFRPSAADVEWAREVLRAYAAAVATGSGVTTVGGSFVDEAIARRARMVLQLAGLHEPDGGVH